MKKLIFYLLVFCFGFISYAHADQLCYLHNIVVEQREDSFVDYFLELAEDANPEMPSELLTKIANQSGNYSEAWLQISFPEKSQEFSYYRVVVTTPSEEVILLSEYLVNFGDLYEEGTVLDSIRVAVKKDASPEIIIQTLKKMNLHIEVFDDEYNRICQLPLAMEQFDEEFVSKTSGGFKIYISYGRIRPNISQVDVSFLPSDIYVDYMKNSDLYYFVDLYGAKVKDTDNPVLGVQFKVENREHIWAIPSNEHIYFSSEMRLTANCDNLLWKGPEFISITLLCKKKEGIEYSYQVYDEIKDLQIRAYFSPIGYGSLEEIRGDTIYGPKIGTVVDMSHFRSWMFE